MNEGKKTRLRWLFAFLIALFFLPNVFSLSCVGISENSEWKDIAMREGITSYFSTRIYNSSAGGGECEPANYEINLSLVESGFEIDKVFDYNVSPSKLFLGNNENSQVLVALTPEINTGRFTVLVTVKRLNLEEGGTMIISTATAKLNVTVGDVQDSSYLEAPFWTVRKDCPGGFVVREGEECPRAVCRDGNLVYGEDLCPEELFVCGNGLCEQYENWNNCLEDCEIPEGWEPPIAQPAQGKEEGIGIELIIAIIAIVIAGIALAFAFFYIRQAKKQLKGRRLG